MSRNRTVEKKPHIRYSLKTRFQYRYHAVFATVRQLSGEAAVCQNLAENTVQNKRLPCPSGSHIKQTELIPDRIFSEHGHRLQYFSIQACPCRRLIFSKRGPCRKACRLPSGTQTVDPVCIISLLGSTDHTRHSPAQNSTVRHVFIRLQQKAIPTITRGPG